MNDIRQRHIGLLRKSLRTINNVVANADPATLTTLRDGEEGWTILEVVCHLRDFDEIFYQRALQIINEDNPSFTPRDHEAMAVEGRYNEQNIDEVLDALNVSRERFAQFFERLTPEQWERSGTHPVRGPFSLTDAVIQVGHHDNDHLEQITRILIEGVA